MNNDYERRGLSTLAALGVLRMGPRTATQKGPRPNAVVGALIVSPSAIQDKMRQVNSQFQTMDAEVKLNATRPEFLTAWGEFRDNWQKFFDDHQSLTKILLTGTGTLDRKTTDYQTQLATWYEALQKENPNARLVFPPPLPPTAPPNGSSVPWWGISALTIVGTAFFSYIAYASYRYGKDALAKKQMLEEDVVPAVLSATGVPDSFTRLHLKGRAHSHDRDLSRETRDPVFDGQVDAYKKLAREMGRIHEDNKDAHAERAERRRRMAQPAYRSGAPSHGGDWYGVEEESDEESDHDFED